MLKKLPEVKIGFIPANRGFFSAELAAKVRGMMIDAFNDLGIKYAVPDESLTRGGLVENKEEAEKTAELFRKENVNGIIIFACNFGDEVAAIQTVDFADLGVPVFLGGADELNKLDPANERIDSFCGVISISKALHRRSIPYSRPRKPICLPNDKGFREDLERFALTCRVVSGMLEARIGAFGTRPVAFETCEVNPGHLRSHFGIEIIQLDLYEVIAIAKKYENDPRVKDGIAEAKSKMKSIVSDETLNKEMQLLLTIEDFVRENDIDAMGVQCWNAIQELWGISPCMAMSIANEKLGVPCACEVDIHGAVTMHMLRLTNGQPPFLGDWNNIVSSVPNTLNFWHCGVFPSKFAKSEVRIDRQSVLAPIYGDDNTGGTLEFELQEGAVTLSRLTETDYGTFKLLIEHGNIIDAPESARGSYGFIQVPDIFRLYNALLDHQFIHHGVATYGNHGLILKESCRYLNIEPVIPNIKMDSYEKSLF